MMVNNIADTNLQKLLQIRVNHAINGMSIDSLTTSDSTILVAIGASFPATHAGQVARIWFTAAYHLLYYEIMPASDTGNLSNNNGQRDGNNNQSNSGVTTSKPYISIYPNPASDKATVSITNSKWDDGALILVTDVYGRKIASVKPEINSTRTDVDTHSWLEGVYYFSVHLSNGATFNSKLVIQK